ncbi:MAG: sulfite exporter TauE/SafE family protein [Deltaproteobacteria bacterium]|nr:MAG: sulfite exporter TauE/SafE family protein [Deltaproteobacteria bacterium]
MSDPLIVMGFTTGLLGAGHCIGMCGPLVGALALTAGGRPGGWLFPLLYNAGRVATYTLIGALAGWLGSALAYAEAFRDVTRILLIGSDLFIIAVGLGTAGLFAGLNVARLDFPGPFRAMTNGVQHLRRLPVWLGALPLGLLFGLLPCGYLYAVAITAAQGADPLLGAATLFAFGLGTVPSLLLVGSVTQWLGIRARQWMLRTAGVLVTGMGVVNLVRHLRLLGWLA